MTKNTKQAKRNTFSREAQALLKSVADQPWGIGCYDEVRILSPDGLRVCPLCMVANRKLATWAHELDAIEAMRAMGWPISKSEVRLVMNAADEPSHPLRGELVRLLGGIRREGANGEPEVTK